jgi:CRISPR/Cas system-associated exonuclease Cas4 (RecB family)
VALAYYHGHLQHGQVPTPHQVDDALLYAWKEREKQMPIHLAEGKTTSDLVDQGIALIEAYMSEQPPSGIIAVEKRLTVPLFNSRDEPLDKPLVAVVDLLCRNETDLIVTEFKTSKRSMSESEINISAQATCYHHAVRERYDQAPKVQYKVLVKTKTPRVQTLSTERTESDSRRLGDLVQTIDLAIQAEVFYPNESPLNCSSCPYRRPCRQWSAEKNCKVSQTGTELVEAPVC